MDFTELVDLAAERLGGAVLFANDEFFAPKENLLKASLPIFIEGKYTDLGKWMDGWESRRRRTPGFDWCIVRLGLPGIIRGVIVDTSYFLGNYPEQCSIEAGAVDGQPDVDQLTSDAIRWIEILPVAQLKGDSQNPFAAVENAGLVLSCSDMFFGHRHNLIMPGRAVNMSDGWETKRRRGPGYDWVIIKLGAAGQIRRLEIDTSYFKGNYPESCSLEACSAVGLAEERLVDLSMSWKTVLPRTKLQAHTRHYFTDDILDAGIVSHVRFNIFPDGGVSRLRIHGAVAE